VWLARIVTRSTAQTPSRQGVDRAGRAPGPPLDLVAPLAILAMLAHAFLAVMTAVARAETPSPQGLIALTANEIRPRSNLPDHELRLEY
jgi:hypothetical protein